MHGRSGDDLSADKLNMGQNGGARPGAGRPRLFATKLAEAIVRNAEENADELAKALMDKALGKTDSPVDVAAMKELFDRGLGRALQNVDLTSDGKALPTPIIALNVVSGDNGPEEIAGPQ